MYSIPYGFDLCILGVKVCFFFTICLLLELVAGGLLCARRGIKSDVGD